MGVCEQIAENCVAFRLRHTQQALGKPLVDEQGFALRDGVGSDHGMRNGWYRAQFRKALATGVVLPKNRTNVVAEGLERVVFGLQA